MASKSVIVIKFGTASITTQSGGINEKIISEIARQVAALQPYYSIVLVSSGAVGAGKEFLKNFKGSLIERKAAAAIGNPLLVGVYGKYFSKYGISIAQSLCERHHFANRNQFLQLKETYQELWKNGIIPIANENDVVSNLELKFSDNDELATLIATGFGASHLLFSTSVGGLLDKEGNIIPNVDEINASIFDLANKEKTAVGLGGMVSKLTFARLASTMGIKVVIFGIDKEDGILNAMEGKAGTVFIPKAANLSARKKWLGSGSLISGIVKVDSGAEKALLKRKSLLAVGVKKVEGAFEANEIIQIQNEKGEQIAVARANFSSKTIVENLNTQNFEIAHADDIVVA
ncbi:MAG: glutamate 5-kinase [Bacteroidota bacterium]